jgi:hypothetical protein
VQFCQLHWNALREAIARHGLSALVPDSADTALASLREELAGVERTIDTYDPLMAAHFAIINNLMEEFGLVVMIDEGCPLCHANEAHARQCTDVNCALVNPYDEYIELAAAGQVEVWKSFRE